MIPSEALTRGRTHVIIERTAAYPQVEIFRFRFSNQELVLALERALAAKSTI